MADYKIYGVTFNGKHSSEFDLRVVDDKEVTFPKKKKYEISIPYSNSNIDLSNLYGGPFFESRTFKLTFRFISQDRTKESLYAKWTEVVNWLMGTAVKTKLVDDVQPFYYYMAEVVNAPTFEEVLYYGTLTVEWECAPFRVCKDLYSGDNWIWDTFDFNSDIIQETQFTIENKQTIYLTYTGISQIKPIVTTTNDIVIKTSMQSVTVKAGHKSTTDLVLSAGRNELTITGSSKVSFSWYKEVI